MKICVTCNLNLPLDDFDDRSEVCKLCVSDGRAEASNLHRAAREQPSRYGEGGLGIHHTEVFDPKSETLPRWRVC